MMATLRNGFLPCNHPVFAENSFPNFPIHKHELFLAKFKYEASTARNLVLKAKAHSTQKNPQSHLVSISESARKDYCVDGHQSINEFDKRLSFFLNPQNRSYNCKEIHVQIVKLGAIRWNSLIGNKLAVMYLKGNGSLDDARRVFDEIPERGLALYAALIGSYCRSKKWVELFSVLGLMVLDGMLPDRYLIPTILKACSAVGLERGGKMIHGYVVRKELGTDAFIRNGLIDLYANCGNLRYSRSVFDVMQERDVVTWTALVSAYMDAGLLDEAEDIFQSMGLSGVQPDLVSWNALVSGFARNGEIDLSIRCLEEMQEKGVMPKCTSWNAIISGCFHNGYFEDALDVFCKMLWFPEKPNGVTIASILPSCAGLKDLKLGKAIHGYTLKSELCRNEHVEGSLVDLYSKCGRTDYAEKVFVKVKTKNSTMWNEMIAAHVNEGKMEAALGLLKTMINDGVEPDEITYNMLLAGHARNGSKTEAYALLSEMSQLDLKPNIVSLNGLITGFQQAGLTQESLKLFRIMQSPTRECFLDEVPFVSTRPNAITLTGSLAACADLLLLRQGKEIHQYIVKNDFEPNIFVQSALVDMYAKCHNIGLATKVFWNIKDRNTVAWNTLIAGYIKNSQPEEALELFQEMLCEGTEPSSITFMILLPACGEMAALNVGRMLHGYIMKSQLAELKNVLASALIDMYEKCSFMQVANLEFDKYL